MGIVTLKGTSSENPTSPAPITGRKAVREPVAATPGQGQETLFESTAIQNTFGHRLVKDLSTRTEEAVRLARYLEGARLPVTYYWRITGADQRGIDTGVDVGNNEYTYARINDFEVISPNGLESSYDGDGGYTMHTGTIIFYPGLTPHVGDLFLYQMEQGRVGKFKVTSVEPMSERSISCYSTTVQLIEYVGQEEINLMERQVIDVLYFDQESYLSERSVLLKSSDRQLLEDIELCMRSVSRHYHGRFFDGNIDQVVRPDGAFDPYLAHFMSVHFPTVAFPHYPRHFNIGAPLDNASFWEYLSNPDTVHPENVPLHFVTRMMSYDGADVFIGPLINTPLVHLVDDPAQHPDATPYISNGLVDLDGEAQTPFDRMVRLYFDHRKIDPETLLVQARDFHLLAETDKFYRGPIIMYLLSLMKQAVKSGKRTFVEAESAQFVPTVVPVTNSDMSGPYLVRSTTNRPLGIIDHNGYQHPFTAKEVHYNDATVTMYLMRILHDVYGEWLFDTEQGPHSAEWSAGVKEITVGNSSTISPGMAVEGVPGIPSGTIVTEVASPTILKIDREPTDGSGQLPRDVGIAWPTFFHNWKLVTTGKVGIVVEDAESVPLSLFTKQISVTIHTIDGDPTLSLNCCLELSDDPNFDPENATFLMSSRTDGADRPLWKYFSGTIFEEWPAGGVGVDFAGYPAIFTLNYDPETIDYDRHIYARYKFFTDTRESDYYSAGII